MGFGQHCHGLFRHLSLWKSIRSATKDYCAEKKYILRHYLLKQLKLHFTKHVIYLGKSKQVTLFNTITEWLDVALIGQNITCVGISNVRYFGVSFLQTYEYYP